MFEGKITKEIKLGVGMWLSDNLKSRQIKREVASIWVNCSCQASFVTPRSSTSVSSRITVLGHCERFSMCAGRRRGRNEFIALIS